MFIGEFWHAWFGELVKSKSKKVLSNFHGHLGNFFSFFLVNGFAFPHFPKAFFTLENIFLFTARLSEKFSFKIMPYKISETEHKNEENTEPLYIVKGFKNLKTEKSPEKRFEVNYAACQILKIINK